MPKYDINWEDPFLDFLRVQLRSEDIMPLEAFQDPQTSFSSKITEQYVKKLRISK